MTTSKTLRILAIGDDDDAPGFLGQRARELGHEVVLVSRFGDPASLSLAGYQLVLPLGSVWSVSDAPNVEWIATELSLLRAAIASGVPILGVCFGGQELAVALGGTVAPAAHPELGWVSIETTDHELVPAGPWFSWHHDEIHAPPGACVFATNPSGVQAFRHGIHLGVQFHPEVTLPVIEMWCAKGRSDLVSAGVSGPEIVAESVLKIEQARSTAFQLMTAFLGSLNGGS